MFSNVSWQRKKQEPIPTSFLFIWTVNRENKKKTWYWKCGAFETHWAYISAQPFFKYLKHHDQVLNMEWPHTKHLGLKAHLSCCTERVRDYYRPSSPFQVCYTSMWIGMLSLFCRLRQQVTAWPYVRYQLNKSPDDCNEGCWFIILIASFTCRANQALGMEPQWKKNAYGV